MASRKKLGLASSESRTALIKATEQLIREEGFAAVTSRKLAAAAGLKPPLIHYYFDTMEDLFIEVFRRGAEIDLKRLAAAAESEQPLRAIWRLNSDPRSTRFVTEFMALANHSQRIRAEITRYAERIREGQIKIVKSELAARDLKSKLLPAILTVLLANLSRGLVLEAALAITRGHAETEALVEGFLQRFEDGEHRFEDLEALLNIGELARRS